MMKELGKVGFIKKLTGKVSSKSSGCCGVEIKENEETQEEYCCETSEANTSCCETTNKQQPSCC
jgi:hypothetical protein